MVGGDERAGIVVGATVVALNGETVGTVHTVRPHYLMVEGDDEDDPVDYEVPMHAVVGTEGGRVQLSVNLEALNEVRGEGQTVAHRLHLE
jgi:Uncharacterized protein conserved in bacteria (DUF2171)